MAAEWGLRGGRFRAAALLCLLVFLAPAAVGQDKMQAPKEVVESMKKREASPARGGAARGLVRFFRTTISKVDDDRCPMYPTCSQYGEQAMAEHGAVLGLLLLVDRLFHEWSEISTAPRVRVFGHVRYYDPLKENDFWLPRKPRDPESGAPLNTGSP